MRRLFLCLALVFGISLGVWMMLERHYADGPSTAFVVESVRGVLAGTPVSKSWQHRFLAPLLVAALGGPGASAVSHARGLLLLAANLLLFSLIRCRGATYRSAVLAVVALGLLHVLLAYKLEYPWDGLDQIIFVTFGAWAATEATTRRHVALLPLLALGTVNHETILYVPIYFLFSRSKKERIGAVLSAALIAAVVFALRAAFYRGAPVLPDQVFEVPAPVIENHMHIAHNLRALFIENWSSGRIRWSVLFLGATAVFTWMVIRDRRRQAAAMSLVVLATILGFGYVNETRHYLVLVAFWVAYAWPVRGGVTTRRQP